MWSYRVSPVVFWRRRASLYRLEGSRCSSCGHVTISRRVKCPRCGGDMEPCSLPQRGRVISFTVVNTPPRGFEYYTPYVLALVELDGGGRVLAQLTDVDPSEVEQGMEVEAVVRRVRVSGKGGIIVYGYKFRPVLHP
ncbi:MAG: transcriptional regulator [Thermoproteota archaeon]|nr:MAG: transcriptional regulator [Candidatus Korarchaeota archaeon]